MMYNAMTLHLISLPYALSAIMVIIAKVLGAY